jgi:hypothetical protein
MSRAFVNEDAGAAPEPGYRLPDPSSPYYPEAAAWALIQGADAGDSRGAPSLPIFRETVIIEQILNHEGEIGTRR